MSGGPVVLDTGLRGVAAAADILRRGGLVALPTETVYGLGADAGNPQALARIFAAKGRPADHPLIVHLASAAALAHWARELPPAAMRLAQHFWPGPLTLVLRRAPGVLDAVTGGQDTVGLRVPGHPVARAVLEAFGGGVAAPSANRFGRLSPTTAAHVAEELGDAVDAIVDAGPCEVGIESTILDLSGARPRLLRPGAIGAAALADVLGAPLEAPSARPAGDVPRVPGSLASHYAPRTPLALLPAPVERALPGLLARHGSLAVLAAREPPPDLPPGCRWLRMPAEVEDYGRLLYARLREADALHGGGIIVEALPDTSDWDAVRDRLLRAAAGR